MSITAGGIVAGLCWLTVIAWIVHSVVVLGRRARKWELERERQERLLAYRQEAEAQVLLFPTRGRDVHGVAQQPPVDHDDAA